MSSMPAPTNCPLRDLAKYILEHREHCRLGNSPADSSKVTRCLKLNFPGVNCCQLEQLLTSVERELTICPLDDVPDVIVKNWVTRIVVPKFATSFYKTFCVHLRRLIRKRASRRTTESPVSDVDLINQSHHSASSISPDPLLSLQNSSPLPAGFQSLSPSDSSPNSHLSSSSVVHVIDPAKTCVPRGFDILTTSSSSSASSSRPITPRELTPSSAFYLPGQKLPVQMMDLSASNSCSSSNNMNNNINSCSCSTFGGAFSEAPTLDGIRQCMRQFVSERNWEKYHTPRNLAFAMVSFPLVSALFIFP
eukprot:Sdes_comp19295_c0_seq1m10350